MKMAALGLLPQEGKHIYADFQKMIDWVEKLEEVDVQGVTPLTTLSPEVNQWAEDVPEKSLSSHSQEALTNAPEHDGAYFYVPQKQKPAE